MTIISATCIAKSKHPACDKIISTVECVYPRWIHAEGRTHRLVAIGEEEEDAYRTPSPMEARELSRNASSSRAMPVERMINDIMMHPAVPLFWGKNIKGMQAGEEINEPVQIGWAGNNPIMVTREEAWLEARDNAITQARWFDNAGYAKQIVNRLLEPFSHIRVVFTATEWTNFFGLRIHADAEPHIKLLAEKIREAIENAPTKILQFGQWHTPYVIQSDQTSARERTKGIGMHYWRDLKKVSVARCARTSFHTFDGKLSTFEEDLALHDKLVANAPLHASPTEHQATPDPRNGGDDWAHPELHGNLVGFIQNRKTIAGEHIDG